MMIWTGLVAVKEISSILVGEMVQAGEALFCFAYLSVGRARRCHRA